MSAKIGKNRLIYPELEDSKMSIRKKILGGFIIVVILGTILGVVGLVSTNLLTGEARELEKFQAEAANFADILSKHYVWRNGLSETVMAGTAFTGSLDPSTCALGSWLNSDQANNISDREILALLDKISAPHDYIHHNATLVTAKVDAGDLIGAQHELMNVVLPKLEEVIDGLTAIGTRYNVLVSEEVLSMEQLGSFASVIILIVIIVAVIAAMILAFIISNSISKPLSLLSAFMKKAGTTGDIALRQDDIETIGKYSKVKDEIGQTIGNAANFVKHVSNISDELENVASGDLTSEMELQSDKDKMGLSLRRMIDSLNQIFGDINASSGQVSSGSKQVADGAQSLAQGSTQQAASIEELSASIAEISNKTKDNAEKAGKAVKLANTIKNNAEKGSRQMDEMTSAVKSINTASQNISRIIKVIDDIAFQTNILALNAAVEAARAGQHGKGFAVVAEEVRNLASKSAAAAKETEEMIENSMKKAELGSRIANETAASLAEIVQGINESSQIVSEIALSSDEQAAGITQINIGIDQVAQVVHQNSATAQESAAASEEMSGQSAMLEELVSLFKLKDERRITGS